MTDCELSLQPCPLRRSQRRRPNPSPNSKKRSCPACWNWSRPASRLSWRARSKGASGPVGRRALQLQPPAQSDPRGVWWGGDWWRGALSCGPAADPRL